MKLKFVQILALLLVIDLSAVSSLRAVPNEKKSGKKSEKTEAPKESKTKSSPDKNAPPDPKKLSYGKNKKTGDKMFKRGSVQEGLPYYEEALTKKPTKTLLYQYLADGSFLVRDYRTAEKYYKMIIDADDKKHKNLASLYQYALTEKYLGNYETSRDYFNKFIKLAKGIDEFAKKRIDASREAQGSNLGITQRDNKDPKEFKTTHADESINHQYGNSSPVLKDSKTLYYSSFTSDKTVVEKDKEKLATFSRLYTSSKNGSNWGMGELVKGSINSVNAHVGTPTFTSDGKTMYYTQCVQDATQRMRCNIFKSSPDGEGWSAGSKLDDNVNATGFTTTDPSVGKSEAGDDVLFFASDRTVGKGMDIFYSKMNPDGSFGKAKSIGPVINTKGDETSPYYDYKSSTLYFSSNGHVNIGGLDVFRSSVKGGDWSEPENIGMPVNSSVDDKYFAWNEMDSVGFLVSNRSGGFGLKGENCCDDVYRVERTKLHIAIRGKLVYADSTTVLARNGLVVLSDAATQKELGSYYANDGTYFFDLDAENNYQLVTRKTGCFEITKPISTVGIKTDDTMTLDFELKFKPVVAEVHDENWIDTSWANFQIGEFVGIVFWDYDKYYLTDGAPDTLEKVVKLMKAFPKYVLEVGSHTDAKGSQEYNLGLAGRRSESVMKYLKSKNIEPARLVSKSYGKIKPIAPNTLPDGSDYPEGRAMNRRTEFKILGADYRLTHKDSVARRQFMMKDSFSHVVAVRMDSVQNDSTPHKAVVKTKSKTTTHTTTHSTGTHTITKTDTTRHKVDDQHKYTPQSKSTHHTDSTYKSTTKTNSQQPTVHKTTTHTTTHTKTDTTRHTTTTKPVHKDTTAH